MVPYGVFFFFFSRADVGLFCDKIRSADPAKALPDKETLRQLWTALDEAEVEMLRARSDALERELVERVQGDVHRSIVVTLSVEDVKAALPGASKFGYESVRVM